MKKSIVFCFILFGFSLCAQNTRVEVLREFVNEVIDCNKVDIDAQQPIATINELAEKQAEKTLELTEQNASITFLLAKKYKTCVVTVGNHSIFKVIDFEDCSPSGAWRACMPMSKGYIQKAGVLNEVKDYLKNGIGRPDSQSRKVFLFNKKIE